MIKQRFPNLLCHNRGRGGDTLLEVANRLINILKTGKIEYSIIVIEAGHNDILLPFIKSRWPIMRVNWVTPASQLGVVLDETLSSVKSFSNAEIILTTLSCIGEIFESPLNQQRRLINEQIKLIGHRYDAHIADISSIFDDVIKESKSSEYIMDNPINLVIDYFRSKKSKWANNISEKRNLKLTIDGGHLNSKGAEIYFKEISKIIEEILYLL
jgi:lysophospholipase L1-like esterase